MTHMLHSHKHSALTHPKLIKMRQLNTRTKYSRSRTCPCTRSWSWCGPWTELSRIPRIRSLRPYQWTAPTCPEYCRTHCIVHIVRSTYSIEQHVRETVLSVWRDAIFVLRYKWFDFVVYYDHVYCCKHTHTRQIHRRNYYLMMAATSLSERKLSMVTTQGDSDSTFTS